MLSIIIYTHTNTEFVLGISLNKQVCLWLLYLENNIYFTLRDIFVNAENIDDSVEAKDYCKQLYKQT